MFAADDAGIIDEVTPEAMRLDGRTFGFTDQIVAFSAGTLERVTLAGRAGQYVQVGRDGERIAWVAVIGSVLTEEHPVVLFEGDLVDVSPDSVTFATGLVLRVAEGVRIPERGHVAVALDPGSGQIIELVHARE